MATQRMRWLGSSTYSMDVNLSKPWEMENRGAWRASVRGVAKSRAGLGDRTAATEPICLKLIICVKEFKEIWIYSIEPRLIQLVYKPYGILCQKTGLPIILLRRKGVGGCLIWDALWTFAALRILAFIYNCLLAEQNLKCPEDYHLTLCLR